MLQISALALAGTLGLLALPATAGADVLGQLTQLPGTAGCLSLDGTSEEGAATCRDVRDLDGPSELVISPDGRSAYAVTYTGNDGLLAFARDPATGALEQLAGTDGCLSRDGSGEDGAGSCTDVRALREGGDGRGMAFSSDGRFLYVASQATDAVVVFARDPATSRLTQLDGTAGCVSRTGAGASGELAGT
jgi:6-phosphogluconolactonase (cycloisomerase 2 family)